MSCIAGIEQDGKVFIGGDSAGVAGLDIIVRADEKVFVNNTCLFGFTSSFRMGQILRYQLAVPDRPSTMPDDKFVHTLLIEAIRKVLKDFGYSTVNNNTEAGGEFLLGYAGRLYDVGSDYQVSRSVEPFAACGCGASYALAVLHTIAPEQDPEYRLTMALEAAEHFSCGVRRPFVILNIGGNHASS